VIVGTTVAAVTVTALVSVAVGAGVASDGDAGALAVWFFPRDETSSVAAKIATPIATAAATQRSALAGRGRGTPAPEVAARVDAVAGS
jgi:hypothetical protein